MSKNSVILYMRDYTYLVGQRINDISVIEIITPGTQFGTCRIICHRCDKEKEVPLEGVLYKTTKTCGCGRYTHHLKGPKHQNFVSLLGQKFGKLKVLRYDTNINATRVRWICSCECGNEKSIIAKHLVSGATTSCGCGLFRSGEYSRAWKGYKGVSGKYLATLERNAKKRGLTFKINGQDVWNQYLKQNKRCSYTNWEISFKGFNQKGSASVDRIDSSRGYEVDNIQIVDKKVNMIKWDLSEKDFLTTCKRVVEFRYEGIS